MWLEEVARAGHPGDTNTEPWTACGTYTYPSVSPEPFGIIHVSSLALFMSHFPSDKIEVGTIFQGSSSADVCLKGR